jgi:hypothetical protein
LIKKLNLLNTKVYENDYALYITAPWIVWKSDENLIFNGNIPIDVYEPDLKEFQKEFVKIIKDREN